MKTSEELYKLPTDILNYYHSNPFENGLFFINYFNIKKLEELNEETKFSLYQKLVEIYDRIYNFQNYESLKPSKKDYLKKIIENVIKYKLILHNYINKEDLFEFNSIYDLGKDSLVDSDKSYRLFLDNLHRDIENFFSLEINLKKQSSIVDSEIFKFAVAFSKDDGFFRIKDELCNPKPRDFCKALFGEIYPKIYYQYMCSNIIGIFVNGKIFETDYFQKQEFENNGRQKKNPPTRLKQRIFFKLEFQENFNREFFEYFRKNKLNFHPSFIEYLKYYQIEEKK